MALTHARFEALFSGLDWREVKALAARPPTAAGQNGQASGGCADAKRDG